MEDRFSSDNFDSIYLLHCSDNIYNSVRVRCRWQVSVCCVEGKSERWNVCTVKVLSLGCWHVCIREYITYSRIPLNWQPLDRTGNGLYYIPDYHTVPSLN